MFNKKTIKRITRVLISALVGISVFLYSPLFYFSGGGVNIGFGNDAFASEIAPLANVQLEGGGFFSLALMSDNTVKAWGENKDGQLGLGTEVDQDSPRIISRLTGARQIAAGGGHTIALMDDGTVEICGSNYYGQLGLGDTVDRTSPATIHGLTGVKQVSAGGSYTIVLMNDGTVKAWGNNDYGQLGVGNTTDRTTPTTIPGLAGVRRLEAGIYHTIVLMDDNTVKIWGRNNYSQLGLGDTTDRTSPTTIPGLILNTKPVLGNIIRPIMNYTSSTLEETLIPSINVSDANNNTLICKYYIDDEALPRDTKTVSDTITEKILDFYPINLGELSAGSYKLKFHISDGLDSITQTVSINIDRSSSHMLVENITEASMTLRFEDSFPDDTQYQISCGPRWINSQGEMTTEPSWITLVNKRIIITGITPGTMYSFTAKARNQYGEETPSCSTAAVTQPVSPDNVTASALNDNTIRITWNEVNGADSYIVECDGIQKDAGSILGYDDTNLSSETTHRYRVCAVKDGVAGTFSSFVTAETKGLPPIVPLNIRTESTGSIITVTWDSIDQAAGYEIEADGSVIDCGLKTTYTHSGLIMNTKHSYRIRAKNSEGTGEWSSIITAQTTFQPPQGIINVNSYPEDISVTLIWDAVQDAESYDIDFDGIVVNVGLSNFCRKAGLMPDTEHTYRVRAVNAAGQGDWSEYLTITTYMLGTPKNISTIEGEDKIILKWDVVGKADTYIIQANGQIIGSAGVYVPVDHTTDPTIQQITLIHTGLTPETKYEYSIKAQSVLGESAWSIPVAVYTLPVKPEVPTNITASITNNIVTITWDAVEGAIDYDVELDGVLIENGNSTVYVHEELLKSTNHEYRVRAKNAAIEGDWSSLLRIKTMAGLPEAPKNIKVSTTPTITTLSWDMEEDSTGYDIEVDGVVVENISKTSYRHRRITPLTEHRYRIRTRNITGISPWSGYIINNSIKALCKKGNDVNLGLTATDIMDFSKYTLTVNYNPDVIEVTDLCIFSTKNELAPGIIEGTGITVTSFTPGSITFIVDKEIPPGHSWTGIVNSIRFKAKVSGGTSITYAVYSVPEE